VTTTKRLTTLLTLALLGAAATEAGEPLAKYAYPQYQGPDGNFRPPFADVPLTDNPNDVRMRWNGPYNMGIGKTGSQHLHYNYDNTARGAGLGGREDLIHGGANSVIAAEGKIFVSYFVGKSQVLKVL
jgi:hypothetical protein